MTKSKIFIHKEWGGECTASSNWSQLVLHTCGIPIPDLQLYLWRLLTIKDDEANDCMVPITLACCIIRGTLIALWGQRPSPGRTVESR